MNAQTRLHSLSHSADDFNTLREIDSQAETWAAAIEVGRSRAGDLSAYQLGDGDFFAIGCGSALYAADYLARTVPRGSTTRAWPSGELWSGHSRTAASATLAVSRSGETTETLAAVAAASGPVIAVTCDSTSSLAGMADLVIAVDDAQEQSVVQTRSFTSMILAAATAAGEGPESAPEALDWADFCRSVDDRVLEILSPGIPRAVYVLGNGCRFPLAQEIALKITEMSLVPAVAFSFMEFRHGPISMAEPDVAVVGLVDDGACEDDLSVLATSSAYGARTWALGASTDTPAPQGALRDLHLVAAGQKLGAQLAISQGLDPDRPRNLSAVVVLDDDA